MMDKRLMGIILVLLLFPLASRASAEEELTTETRQFAKASPVNWTAHISFGAYKLRHIDDEFEKGITPAEDIFSNDYHFLFNLGFERFVYQGYGTVGVEGAIGYWQTYGKSLFKNGTKSSDTSVFNLIPTKTSAVYRYRDLWEKYGVPFVPFAKLGLDYYFWWILDQSGDTAEWTPPEGGTKDGYGGTFGFHLSYGLQLCLDFIDPKLALEFDQDVGVNNTYLYFEGTLSKVNDFWAGSSFDLSDHYFMGGLLLEF